MIVSDHLSIWDAAHRWRGIDPNKTNPSDLPLGIQDTLCYLCAAVLNGEISLFIPESIDATDGYGNYFREIRYQTVDELPAALQSCAFAREYDKSALDDLLISRLNLFERSIWGHGQFPDFWEDEKLITDLGGVFAEPAPKEVKKPASSSSSLVDQSLCQAIAKTLWDSIERVQEPSADLGAVESGRYRGTAPPSGEASSTGVHLQGKTHHECEHTGMA